MFKAFSFVRYLAALMIVWVGVSIPALAADKQIKAVVTVGMVSDVVKAVAGERADITTLMGSGVDPHSYRQTRSDVSLLANADIIFRNGLHLEAQLDSLLEKLGARKPVIAVAELLNESDLIEAEGFSGRHDPHVWMDPALWAKTVPIVRDAFIDIDPEHADYYTRNAKIYSATVSKLGQGVTEFLASVPKESRVLITAHDAFGYFGRAFDVEVVGVQGLSTDSEAGLNRIETLVSMLVERKISAVFVESSVSDQNVRALIEGAQARGHKVTIGGTLFSDAMGQEGTYEGSYIGMIDHNAATITRALGGQAPDRGLNGRLTPQS